MSIRNWFKSLTSINYDYDAHLDRLQVKRDNNRIYIIGTRADDFSVTLNLDMDTATDLVDAISKLMGKK
jgi:hypothetical protein